MGTRLPVPAPAARGDRYWGLEYHNNTANFADYPDALYSFARFKTGGARVMVIVSNFADGQNSVGQLRLPEDLLEDMVEGLYLSLKKFT